MSNATSLRVRIMEIVNNDKYNDNKYKEKMLQRIAGVILGGGGGNCSIHQIYNFVEFCSSSTNDLNSSVASDILFSFFPYIYCHWTCHYLLSP